MLCATFVKLLVVHKQFHEFREDSRKLLLLFQFTFAYSCTTKGISSNYMHYVRKLKTTGKVIEELRNCKHHLAPLAMKYFKSVFQETIDFLAQSMSDDFGGNGA